ncbi:UDP-glucose/GDP-mannose dehydrogenase family protein [Halobacillus sp. A1]|uniref:UDP-glucose dehydrogenase family protein n=1 Tax=Halobacillus sp. A1 TaxID=2880262 RepID=UPI0020A6CDC4|nr:UDP-glucose/GDP-mannose dehydrogenase family protein [Halobacillus sp. A1]MCP3029825.1 UDP-glucose/GDP-mannose dehydrogenase family protein [Halobacillus sp. A1]
MKILIIGMGYVGTTMGAALANTGHEVTGLDVDKAKIESLTKGILYFHEPDLQEMLSKQLQTKRLSFTSDPKEAIKDNEIIFITVGTPSLKNGNADLTYIKQAAEMIGKYKNGKKIVVVKSTVPLGTTENVKQWIEVATEDPSPFDVVMNPEFLREGRALQDALNPDRVVLGSHSDEALNTLEKIYSNLHCPFIRTTPVAAEMTKYASNAFLATKISFINEIARLCDQFGIHVQDVAKGMGLDDRIGGAFLKAGLGYGGSCFPKDVKELLWTADHSGCPLRILKEVERVNHDQPQYFIEKVMKKFASLEGKRIVILGLSFKPHTDDIRESVSFSIINKLLQEKANIIVHDPIVKLPNEWVNKGIKQINDPYEATEEADLIIICTDWPLYKEIDWAKISELVKGHYIFDGRNILEADCIKKLGFNYEGIGYD